jgi:hypothetical protein
MRKPPLRLIEYVNKMPRRCRSLLVILDGGRVENPEFVVWDRDSFTEELWKWKRKEVRVAGSHVEFWAKHGQEFYRINPNAV